MIKNNYLNKKVMYKVLIININTYIKNYNMGMAISSYWAYLCKINTYLAKAQRSLKTP